MHEKRKILACRRHEKKGWTECGKGLKSQLLAKIQSRFVAVASVISYLELEHARVGMGGKGKGKEKARVG